EFAVQSIRTWLDQMGRPRYAGMRELMITADCGGSNSARSRLWKVELQKLADEIAMPIKVCHYPPGTSKWNKIEHRMFCHITQNWRARPLTSRAAVVELIASTTTKTGLRIACALDSRPYQKGIKITDAEMAALDIRGVSSAGAQDILLGYLPALEGPFATLSRTNEIAAQIAIDEINTAGGIAGKKIRIVSFDTASKPDQAVIGLR